MQLALVAFGPTNGTARCSLTPSPWTADLGVFTKWLDALPLLMEGVGDVAAYEAVAEAMSMLELPSRFTPDFALKGNHSSEIVMLWLTEAEHVARCLVTHPALPNVSGNVSALVPRIDWDSRERLLALL